MTAGTATGGFAIGWRQVASSFVLLSAIAMMASSYGVLAVPLSQEFQPTRMVLMLTMTVMSAVSGLLAPFIGTLMDRFSLRLLMVLGTLMLGAGYLAVSYATSFTQILVIFGLFMAPANLLLGPVAVTVLLSRWFIVRRGTALGIAIAGISMGGVFFPPFIQFLLDSYEWRSALRLFAVFLLLLTMPAAAFVVNAPADKGLHPDGADADPEPEAKSDSGAAVSKSGRAPGSVASILSDPSFWLIGLLFAVVFSGMKGMVTNLVPLAVDQGIDAIDAAFLISIFSMAGLVSKVVFAALADRLGPRILTLLALAGFAGGMASISQAASGYFAIVAGACLMGLFGGLMVPLQSFLVPRIFGRKVVGRAMGMMTTIGACASLATPPLFGLMFDLTGSYSTISMIFAGLAMVAILIVPYVRMHPRDQPGAPLQNAQTPV